MHLNKGSYNHQKLWKNYEKLHYNVKIGAKLECKHQIKRNYEFDHQNWLNYQKEIRICPTRNAGQFRFNQQKSWNIVISQH